LHSLTIRELEEKDLASVKTFTDQAIGKNYYSLAELQSIYNQSILNDRMCSFVLADPLDQTQSIRGIRICYPPGRWAKGKGSKIRPDLWGVDLQNCAYFQSLFVDERLRGQGWGPKLSEVAIGRLRQLGAKAIICHSWVESPGDSSGKYLRSLGFQPVIQHPQYWKEVDYICTRDGNPCMCTAEEMILKLEQFT
jgi:ribosomal protein S18 acetylase RimI-like enzyme